MPSFRQKALGYYRDQDLRIITAACRDGSLQPYVVEGLIRGYQTTYRITLADGRWTCTCNPTLDDCAHRAAVQMATGYRSSAAKEVVS